MSKSITFTPQEVYTIIMAVCGLITAVAAAVAVIIKAISKAKAPDAARDQRLDAQEIRLDQQDEKMKEYDKHFAMDKRRIDLIEEGSKKTQQGILALMSHAINGNDVEKLKEARDDLEKYLVNR